MTKIRSMAGILALVAAGAAAGTAFAQGPGYMHGQGGGPGYGPGGGREHGMMQRPGEHHGGMLERGHHMARALGLSEDQRAKMRQIREDTRRRSWDALGQIRSERFKLREMMRGDHVDPAAAVEHKRKIDELQLQVMRVRLEARNQMLALLTPEQREKARALREQRGGRGNG